MNVHRFLKVPGMPRPASRAKQIQFIEDHGAAKLKNAVWDRLMQDGAAFLTDEQIAILTADIVTEDRVRQHNTLRNRSRDSVRFQQAAE